MGGGQSLGFFSGLARRSAVWPMDFESIIVTFFALHFQITEYQSFGVKFLNSFLCRFLPLIETCMCLGCHPDLPHPEVRESGLISSTYRWKRSNDLNRIFRCTWL